MQHSFVMRSMEYRPCVPFRHVLHTYQTAGIEHVRALSYRIYVVQRLLYYFKHTFLILKQKIKGL
jgi:hypothetical protein